MPNVIFTHSIYRHGFVFVICFLNSTLLPAAAELEYLNVVRYLDHYGVKSHVVKVS